MKNALLFSSLLLLAACKDPAADKSKATTGEAVSKNAEPVKGATNLAFDNTTSKIEWTGSKVTGKHDGEFQKFTGAVSLVDKDPTKSSVKVDIDTDSLTTTPEKLVQHLKSPELFDVAKFPKATFQSIEIKKGGDKGASNTIVGNLTLHGQTKSISFPANVKVEGDTANVDAEFTINRKDFGIVYPGMPNDLIRDDVVIRLKIHANKG